MRHPIIIAIGSVFYLAMSFVAFILIHGTHYAAQGGGWRAWLLTAGDAAASFFWPFYLTWFLGCWILYTIWGH